MPALAIIMVAAVVVSRVRMHPPLSTGSTGAGLDYNFLLLAACVALLAFGAGRSAQDRLMARTPAPTSSTR